VDGSERTIFLDARLVPVRLWVLSRRSKCKEERYDFDIVSRGVRGQELHDFGLGFIGLSCKMTYIFSLVLSSPEIHGRLSRVIIVRASTWISLHMGLIRHLLVLVPATFVLFWEAGICVVFNPTCDLAAGLRYTLYAHFWDQL